MTRQLRIAIGPTRYLPCDEIVELDPRHPLSHGGFQLDVTVDDGLLTSVKPRIGFLHRSAEKLFESRDYRQIMMLANRHDWHSALHGELVIAQVVEGALGITPPRRAIVSRVLLAEVNRMNVCLLFVGCAVGASRRNEALEYREKFLNWYQTVAGSRIHPMINRIGGLAHPVTTDALLTLSQLIDDLENYVPTLTHDIQNATAPIGSLAPIDAPTVQRYGLSGPIARSAGVDADLRRTDPNYAGFPLPPKAPGDGTLADRYAALITDIATSTAIVRTACTELEALGNSPIDVPLPKVVRVPEGATYAWVEGPIGRSGALLVSVGDKLPWRLKLVTPSFHTMQALQHVLIGIPLSELGSVLESIFLVVGDVDR